MPFEPREYKTTVKTTCKDFIPKTRGLPNYNNGTTEFRCQRHKECKNFKEGECVSVVEEMKG